MPIYLYECVKCKKVKELLRKVKDRNHPVKCATCKGKMKKKITGSHFKLIGEGFYKPSIGEGND